MPIVLDELNDESTAKVSDPKFFSSELTGKGGKATGLLSMKNNPANIDPAIQTKPSNRVVKKQTTVNGYTETKTIPLSLIKPELQSYMTKIKYPDLSEMAFIGKDYGVEIYMDMVLNNIIIEKTSVPANAVLSPAQQAKIGPNGRSITTNYQIRYFAIGNPAEKTAMQVNKLTPTKGSNVYTVTYSDNPLQDAIYPDCIPYISQPNLDENLIRDYILNFDLYAAAVEQSENWQEHADVILQEFFDNIKTSKMPANTQAIISEIQHITTYNIPLDLYKKIYESIKNTFSAAETYKICKHNLNLLLSDTMYNLHTNKSLITSFQVPNGQKDPDSVKNLSVEQSRAVKSTEPLILVQAGAGTGKSTLILGRIDYLESCGVNPNDITVLSFTNAAADHITEKNPNVHSMTIARMIHEIYSTNFADHELSTPDTIINTIDIHYPPKPMQGSNVTREFQQHLRELTKKSQPPNVVTNLNNFIEENYDDVIKILNTIKQTSLELEIIICYQKIGVFKEPPSVASKYLIIDEVQDNSIFEFIYMLKYIDKHKENLFIVGDCSQTLYEFRAANPRALNILEGSNTFATYQLNVNYRSNQEILDFANVTLKNIEANQYANIQLQANALIPVTEQSFLDKVKLKYERLAKSNSKATKDAITVAVQRDMAKYIDDCLAKGEQVAILARARATVNAIKQTLELIYPNKSIISLMPNRIVPQTVMSTYISMFWSELKFVPPANIMGIITQEIMNRLDRMPIRGRSQNTPKYVQQFLMNWRRESGFTISVWTNQLNKNQIDLPVFLELVKENMLQYEIKCNAIQQSIASMKNQKNKDSDRINNANILLSTIHSAKGLEFDNVIVLCDNKKLTDEEEKRLYYVAFTRAMKSEYIWAYDTVASPKIEGDYEAVLTKLHAVAPAINSPLYAKSKNKTITIN